MGVIYKLKEGFAWNPLLKIPRNVPCPCDSGKKFKACHLLSMPRVVPQSLADEYKKGMAHVEIIKFIGDEKDKNLETDKKP